MSVRGSNLTKAAMFQSATNGGKLRLICPPVFGMWRYTNGNSGDGAGKRSDRERPTGVILGDSKARRDSDTGAGTEEHAGAITAGALRTVGSRLRVALWANIDRQRPSTMTMICLPEVP